MRCEENLRHIGFNYKINLDLDLYGLFVGEDNSFLNFHISFSIHVLVLVLVQDSSNFFYMEFVGVVDESKDLLEFLLGDFVGYVVGDF